MIWRLSSVSGTSVPGMFGWFLQPVAASIVGSAIVRASIVAPTRARSRAGRREGRAWFRADIVAGWRGPCPTATRELCKQVTSLVVDESA